MMTHARPAINVKFRCWMGLISVAGQYALFPVWLMMWENLIYGQFDILSLNKCSPVNAEINKSPSRFLLPHIYFPPCWRRESCSSGQATGGGCVLAGGQSQLTPRRVRSVPRYYSLYMVSGVTSHNYTALPIFRCSISRSFSVFQRFISCSYTIKVKETTSINIT